MITAESGSTSSPDQARSLGAELRRFVARRLSSPADVEDVVQDVFLRMHRGVGALRDSERFGPWVYQVARSAIGDHRRRRARHPLTDRDAPDLAEAADETDDDREVERELARYVAGLIGTLEPAYREALTLTELEGLTQREAAEQLGITVSGMKSRVQRGREQLRKLLDRCCAIELDARGRVLTCEPRNSPLGPSCACAVPAGDD